jgi:uncharacterized protein with PIN domain
MARQHVSRAITFGPAVALPVWGWDYLREPGHWAGLAVMTAAGLAVIPAAVVLVIFLLPHSGAALVSRERRKRYRHKLVSRGIPREQQRSSRIPDFLRRVTYAADRYRCVYCRLRFSVHELQVDHYVPWSQGGLTVPWNTLSLCSRCNRVKSNYWHGAFYRPVSGIYADSSLDNEAMAAEILAAERRHRLSPLRLTRAAWALGA